MRNVRVGYEYKLRENLLSRLWSRAYDALDGVVVARPDRELRTELGLHLQDQLRTPIGDTLSEDLDHTV